ncbi:hypothetical protein DL95DRAFT_414352 [Leptodontidium sp. 2 PMI_412]|nr:hypothetical protein DL95DRAFT_414352 [Leptodontidium sp. 2 PMI_412]
MLISNKVFVPVNQQPTTYESVLEAWEGALEAMGNLARGIPQRVLGSAALLGISAWHMCPDVVVLREKPKSIKQKDDLFSETALAVFSLLGASHISNTYSLTLKTSLKFQDLEILQSQNYMHGFTKRLTTTASGVPVLANANAELSATHGIALDWSMKGNVGQNDADSLEEVFAVEYKVLKRSWLGKNIKLQSKVPDFRGGSTYANDDDESDDNEPNA